MLVENEIEESMFIYARLVELVPQEHYLRKVNKLIDFSIVDRAVAPYYSKDKGRPSTPPQVLFRMLLVGYLNGITSVRRLCQEVQVNLAYRWFCKLRVEDKVPDHSLFSKNSNERFAGSNIIETIFKDIVHQAKAKGLVRGKHLISDATMIDADAAMDSLEPRIDELEPTVVPMDPDAYLSQLFVAEAQEKELEDKESSSNEEKIEEDKNKEQKNKRKRSINETHRSKTDPDARVAKKARREELRLGYADNILVDSEHNIILDVAVTNPSSTLEGQATVEMIKRSREEYKLQVEDIALDSGYAAGETLHGLKELEINAYVPESTNRIPTAKDIFPREAFIYDQQNDCFICPAKKTLKSQGRSETKFKYSANKMDCANCPLKTKCTKGKYRTIKVSIYKPAVDWANSLRGTEKYKYMQKMRRKIERTFGEAKEFMGLRRARRRGMHKVLEQCLWTALAQNIKRIVKAYEMPRKVGTMALNALKNAIIRPLQAYLDQIGDFLGLNLGFLVPNLGLRGN